MKTRGKPGTIPIRFSPRTLIMSRDRLNSLKIVVFWGLLGHLLDRRQFSPVLSYTLCEVTGRAINPATTKRCE
jgi:hypothetical protein